MTNFKNFTQLTTDIPYPKLNDHRFEQIRFMMEDIKVEAMAVTHVANVRYLTNFSGSNGQLIIFPESLHFITDDRYELQLKEELYNLPNLYIHIARDPWQYGVDSKLFKGLQTLGFESDRMGYSEAVEIRNVIRPVKFKPAVCEIEPFTRPKAPEEVEYMKQSCAVAEKVFEQMCGFIKPGMTEKEVANELVYISRKLGSEGDPFDVIVASGFRSAYPHAAPTDKKIKKNEIVLLDFGCKVHGFCSDITRVVSTGKPTKEQKQIYSIVYEAMQNAIKNARPMMNGKILDEYARSIITKAGFGDYFKHSLGHGIGLAAHESPIITFRKDDQVVPENSVISIEPGIYFPEKFGIRIEDNVLVTRNGVINLTNAPSEITVID